VSIGTVVNIVRFPTITLVTVTLEAGGNVAVSLDDARGLEVGDQVCVVALRDGYALQAKAA
jgi:hypothetical protein